MKNNVMDAKWRQIKIHFNIFKNCSRFVLLRCWKTNFKSDMLSVLLSLPAKSLDQRFSSCVPRACLKCSVEL